MVTSDRFESSFIAGVLMDLPDADASALDKAESLVAAMSMLRRAGFCLLLVPAGTSVQVNPRRRRWWRRPDRKE